MNIISSGIVSKANTLFQSLKTKLGSNIKSTKNSMDERIDAIETALNQSALLTNARIQADAINILKLHHRINAIQLQTKFQKANLYFDDFIDTSGTSNESFNITFDTTTKSYETASTNGTWISNVISSTVNPSRLILVANGVLNSSSYFISKNNGTTYYSITPELLFEFPSDAVSGTSLKIKIEVEPNSKIESVGLIWSL